MLRRENARSRSAVIGCIRLNAYQAALTVAILVGWQSAPAATYRVQAPPLSMFAASSVSDSYDSTFPVHSPGVTRAVQIRSPELSADTAGKTLSFRSPNLVADAGGRQFRIAAPGLGALSGGERFRVAGVGLSAFVSPQSLPSLSPQGRLNCDSYEAFMESFYARLNGGGGTQAEIDVLGQAYEQHYGLLAQGRLTEFCAAIMRAIGQG